MPAGLTENKAEFLNMLPQLSAAKLPDGGQVISEGTQDTEGDTHCDNMYPTNIGLPLLYRYRANPDFGATRWTIQLGGYLRDCVSLHRRLHHRRKCVSDNHGLTKRLPGAT
eukprot:4205740-Pyramimonas_sp.AAC.1